MIFAAVAGPIPGNVSSCSGEALFRSTGAPGAEPEAAGVPAPAAPAAPRSGTTTCSPSASGAARLTCASSARRVVPPARATASAIRVPSRSR